MYVYVLATLDTKGPEAAFVCRRLNELGVTPRLVDTGSGQSESKPFIDRLKVFKAGGANLIETTAAIKKTGDRSVAVSFAANGASLLLKWAYEGGELAGVLALGGSAGTTIGTTAMQALPIGVP